MIVQVEDKEAIPLHECNESVTNFHTDNLKEHTARVIQRMKLSLFTKCHSS